MEFLAKLSVDKLDETHIHLTVDKLEHILDVNFLITYLICHCIAEYCKTWTKYK